MKKVYLLLLFAWRILPLDAAVFPITDYGAIPDGTTLNTEAIQTAIDACSDQGGGTVLIDGGSYLSGTLFLKSGVTLKIEKGSEIMGSPNIEDYAMNVHKNMYKNEPHMDRCLIFAENAVDIGIEGPGTIDGDGYTEHFTKKTGRPMLIRFLNCQRIDVHQIRLLNPAAWTSAWLYCREIRVSNLTIRSRANHNGDGLDFDGCDDVVVTNCSFDNSDDCICLQASNPDRPCQNIAISNCNFTTKWGGIRIGLLSRGDIRNVAVSNCTFRNIQDSGLKIQQCEGGEMSNMVFSNLVMENVPRPIFMTFCQQRACVDTPEDVLEPMNSMHNFSFQNIVVDNRAADKNAVFFITGYPEFPIADVTLSNIQFQVSGGGTADDATKEIKEYDIENLGGWWPEFHIVGTLPAHGLYARHVDGLKVDGFIIRTSSPEVRPAVVLDDVHTYEISGVFSDREPGVIVHASVE